MKKLLGIVLAAIMLFTACSPQPKEEYPPEKIDFGNGNYSWHYFDEKGQRIKYESFRNNVLEEIHYIEFDEEGNKTKDTETDAEGNELLRTETTWENGKMKYEVRYKNGIMSSEDFYDKNECRYLTKGYKDGVLLSWTEGFFDENHRAVMHIYHRADDTVSCMQEYGEDANGSSVTQTSYFDENENLLKVVRKTAIPNGYREEILFEK